MGTFLNPHCSVGFSSFGEKSLLRNGKKNCQNGSTMIIKFESSSISQLCVIWKEHPSGSSQSPTSKSFVARQARTSLGEREDVCTFLSPSFFNPVSFWWVHLWATWYRCNVRDFHYIVINICCCFLSLLLSVFVLSSLGFETFSPYKAWML